MAMVVIRGPLASPLVLVALLAAPIAAGLLLIDAAAAQRVDCRKFVFAPTCRGVAAKRSDSAPARGDDSDERHLSKFLVLSPDYLGAGPEGLSDTPSLARGPEGATEEGGGRLGTEEEEEDEQQEEDEGQPEDGGAGAKGDDGAEEAAARAGGRGWPRDGGWTWSPSGVRGRGEGGARRQDRIRKLETFKTSQVHRKVAKTPATNEWFSSNERRRRRDKGMRRRSEYINYDY